MPGKERSTQSTHLTITRVCGILVFCIGSVIVAGWFFHLLSLTTLRATQAPVPFESALLMMMIGLTLWMLGRGIRQGRSVLFVRFMLVLVAAFGTLRFLETFFGADFTFEYLFRPLYEGILGAPPLATPPTAGLLLCIWGSALLGIVGERHSALRRSIAAMSGFAMFVTSFIVLVGYIFGTPLLFAGSQILITLNGSIVFLVMSVGLIAYAGPDVFPSSFFTGDSVSAQMLRVFYPLIILATILYGIAVAFLHDYPGINIALTSAMVMLVVLAATSAAVAFAARRIGRSIEGAEAARLHAVEEMRDSERRSTQALAKAHRALRVLSESNQALIRATDEAAFLDDVCRCIVDHGGYSMVWIAFLDTEGGEKRLHMAKAAGPTSDYPELLDTSYSDTDRQDSPGAQAIRERRPVIVDTNTEDPRLAAWTIAARARGFRSVIVFPLEHAGEALGVIKIFDREAGTFEPGELELLQELSMDLAFGIVQLRARAELARTRVLMQEAFEEKRLLADIIEQSSQPFSVAYSDGRIGYANQAFVDLLGYTRDELSRIDWTTALTPPEWRAFQQQMLDSVHKTGLSARFEKEYSRKDDTRVPVEVLVHIARDSNGTPLYYSCFSTDITARLRAENAVRESERRFREIFETVQEVAMMLDTGGCLTYCNDYFVTISGWTREELLGRQFFRTFFPEEPELAESFRTDIETALIPAHLENVITVRDGTLRHISWTNVLLRDEHGGVEGVACLGQDVTEREYMMGQLILEKEKAERSDKLKDTFIANISHEIRTPLNVILGYTNVVEDHFAPQADVVTNRFFEMIKAGSQRLMRTVDMMLNISRVEAGAFDTIKTASKPVDNLNRIAQQFQPLAQAKGLVLRWVNAAGDPVISVDWSTFSEAVSHLLDNAIKFTHTGTVTLHLYRDESRELCLDVADTGIGIATEYLPKLFTPYSQEEQGYTRSYEGIGLGLALVKRYLALNGVPIHARSEKNVGTVFTLRLGACDMTTTSAVAAEVAAPLGDVQSRQNSPDRPRLLLVEDDDDSVEFMRDILGASYDLEAVDNAADAWARIDSMVFGAILMDISIRGETNGIELTRQIRAHPVYSTIPVIAITAHAFESDRAMCLEAGCNHFLTKPVDIIALWNILSEVV